MADTKKGYLIRRPAFKFDTAASPSTISGYGGDTYIAPEAVDPVLPFTVPNAMLMPFLYHAGTAWSYSGQGTAPFSEESSVNLAGTGGASGVIAYQAHPTTRRYGVAGVALRSPRTVVLALDQLYEAANLGDPAMVNALLAAVGPTAEQAKASVVCMATNRLNGLTCWAPMCVTYTSSYGGSPTTNSPVNVASWLAGDLLYIRFQAQRSGGFGYFGYAVADSGVDGDDVPDGTTRVEFGTDPETPTIKLFLFVSTDLIDAERTFWSTISDRYTRFNGIFLYPDDWKDTLVFGPDSYEETWNDVDGSYSADTFFTTLAGSLPFSRVAVSGANVNDGETSASDSLAACHSAIISAIQAFWPDEFA